MSTLQDKALITCSTYAKHSNSNHRTDGCVRILCSKLVGKELLLVVEQQVRTPTTKLKQGDKPLLQFIPNTFILSVGNQVVHTNQTEAYQMLCVFNVEHRYYDPNYYYKENILF